SPALLQTSFIKLNQIEIGLNIFAPGAARFFEEMIKARVFCRGIRMARNHFLVPMFDRIGRVFRSILIDPIEHLGIIVKTIGDFFKVVAVKLEKGEKMFVEADRFVVIAVKQPFAMQTGLVDQTRQMNIAAELLVGTARSQLLHEAIYVAGSGRGKLSRDLARSVDNNSSSVIQVPTQSPFDDGASAANTAAAQVTSAGHIDFAFGANGTAKVGCDFVVA